MGVDITIFFFKEGDAANGVTTWNSWKFFGLEILYQKLSHFKSRNLLFILILKLFDTYPRIRYKMTLEIHISTFFNVTSVQSMPQCQVYFGWIQYFQHPSSLLFTENKKGSF